MSTSESSGRRRVFEIASEMLDWTDAEQAQTHGLSALCELLGAHVAVLARLSNFCPAGIGEVRSVIDVGWSSESQRATAVRPYLTLGCRADPSAARLMDGSLFSEGRRLARRTDLLGDHHWYNSDFFNEARASADIDHLVHSIAPLVDTTRHETDEELVSGLTLIRASGDRDFTKAELDFIDLFHNGALPLWTRHRSRTPEERLRGFGLSRRERETTQLLLQGLTPLEVADRLGISLHTCQQYIKSTYRKLEIRSRAQLMARFAGDKS